MIETLFSRLEQRAGFARREAQLRVASAVLETLQTGGRLLVEAPTGVGKSLGYLVPFAAWTLESAGGRCVAATNTKALQRQLVEQDLPLLEEILDAPLNFALAMGGENYVCLRRLRQLRQLRLFGEADESSLAEIHTWARSTATGLRAEISVPDHVWTEICRVGDLCFGRECTSRNSCRYLAARAREAKADILVVNHHLLLSDWASGAGVIPEYEALVIDEAHRFEEAARSILTREISPRRVGGALNALLATDGRRGILRRLTGNDSVLHRTLENKVQQVRTRFSLWFSSLTALYPPPSPRTLSLSSPLPDAPGEDLLALASAIEGVPSESDEEERERDAAVARCTGLLETIREVLSFDLAGSVHWIEHDSFGPRIMVSPLEVAPALHDGFFPGIGAIVFTSATLTTGGNFAYFRRRVGIDWAEELVVDSPFDVENQALLYVPTDLPDPVSEGYAERLAHRIADLVHRSGGGVLALFTSYATMRKVREMLHVPGTEVFMQGDADAYTLVEEFREHPRALLLGTHTFWQGVDIPGEALRCVVITRLPFAVPDSPLLEARFARIRDEGGNPFFEEQVPQAVLLFKQGFGRLIRREDDRGVVAILDSRVRTKSYGRHFLAALPSCRVTGALSDVEDFLSS